MSHSTRRDGRCPIVSLASTKSGVGKTTLAYVLATEVAPGDWERKPLARYPKQAFLGMARSRASIQIRTALSRRYFA